MRKKDTRKGDRHSKEYKMKKKLSPRKPWEGEFIAVDGEGWDGKYTILAMSGRAPAVNREGLSTLDCLHYLTSRNGGNAAYVGFGLSYDFENILRDLPDEDYLTLLAEDPPRGEKRKSVFYEGFELTYIPRKILEIKKELPGYGDRKSWTKSVYLQDALGFFQSSFLDALGKWQIEIPEILFWGKEQREGFASCPLQKVIAYNNTELEKLVELMNKLREADAEACKMLGINANHSPRSWYGPGARAANFLGQTSWVLEHPPFTGNIWEELQQSTGLETPWAAAYFGGRIEAAYKGKISGPLYDYDIASAYPFALSLFPSWQEGDLVKVEGFDPADRIGMYYVRWNILESVGFYPFPFRSQSKNVFFPPAGEGWYMSPEVAAALSLYGGEQVQVFTGFVLAGTEGAGSGEKSLPEAKLCFTARLMAKMAKIRLEAKQEKLPAEKALKLVMNSCYGKTIQQVGSTKNLNVFAAAWITSLCRAMIVRAVGRDLEKNTISIMTDGVLTRKKLEVPLGNNLGEWEESTCTRVLQFLPGVYHIEKEGGEVVKKYRGMSRDFSPRQALESLYTGDAWNVDLRIFVTRVLALHMKEKFGKERFRFSPVTKAEKFSLSSKRRDNGSPLLPGEEYRYYPAKNIEKLRDLMQGSRPYDLKAGGVMLPYDTATSLEELLADERISSVLEMEQLEAYEVISKAEKKRFRKAVMALGGVWDEDYKSLPRWAKRKGGQKLDEMASELQAYDFYLENGNQLWKMLQEN